MKAIQGNRTYLNKETKMRKITVIVLLLLMATCFAFAEEEAETDQVTGMDVVTEDADGTVTDVEQDLIPDAEDGVLSEDGVISEEEDVRAFGNTDPIDLGDDTVVTMTLSKTSYYADGTGKKPAVTLKCSGKTLTEGTHYTLTYSNNTAPGTATVIATAIDGSGYTGSRERTFTIKAPVDLSKVTMTIGSTKYLYADGSPKTPTVTLTYNGKTLTKNTHYKLEYSDNVSAGIATVTAVGIDKNGYTGTRSKSFTIKSKIRLSRVTMTLSKTRYYKTGSAIKPEPVLKFGNETLKKGTHYYLKYSNNISAGKATVKAVFKSIRFKDGSKSRTFTIMPARPKATLITKIRSDRPVVNVTWEKVSCTGYQLQISRYSDFSNAWSRKVSTNTLKVWEMKNGQKYYFRVRAYKTENGMTTYGSWNKWSCKVSTTGPVGNKYSKDGAYVRDKTIRLGGNDYYYNGDGVKSGCSEKMWNKVRNNSSKTKYLIAVDCTKNRTCIFTGKKGNWKLKSYWKCTTGKKSTPTIKGNFKVCGKVSHFGEQKGYSVWHATRIKYEYYFHSILYRPYSKTKVLNGTLGKNLSHGCIRLKKENANWIYKNCKNGTRIVIY